MDLSAINLFFPKALLEHFDLVLAHELGHVEAKEDFIEVVFEEKNILDLLRNSLKFEIINSTNKFHSQIVIFPSVSVLFSHNSKNFYFSYNMFYCHSYF